MPRRTADPTMQTLSLVVKTMRPRQWTKNLIVLLPLLFAGELGSDVNGLRAFAAFVAFCLISGSIYIINDIVDAEQDRLHARKGLRPIASGELSRPTALTAAVFAGATAIAMAWLLGWAFLVTAIGYIALQGVYVFWTKHQVILDVISIAIGFVLRAIAGAAAIGVPGSPWLYLCAGLLALFLGFAKRRHELLLLDGGGALHRPVLAQYTAPLLDSILSSVTAATIVSYALYTFFSPTAREHGDLMLTVPFVVYGLFRYLYLVYRQGLGGSPEDILLTDRPLIGAILLWLLASGALLYLN